MTDPKVRAPQEIPTDATGAVVLPQLAEAPGASVSMLSPYDGFVNGQTLSAANLNATGRDPQRWIRAIAHRMPRADVGLFGSWRETGGAWVNDPGKGHTGLQAELPIARVWVDAGSGALLVEAFVAGASPVTFPATKLTWVAISTSKAQASANNPTLGPGNGTTTDAAGLAFIVTDIGSPEPTPPAGYVVFSFVRTDATSIVSTGPSTVLPSVPTLRSIRASSIVAPAIEVEAAAIAALSGIDGDPLAVSGEVSLGDNVTMDPAATLLGGAEVGAAKGSFAEVEIGTTLDVSGLSTLAGVSAASLTIRSGGTLEGEDATTTIEGFGTIEGAVIQSTAPGRLSSARFELGSAASPAANTITRTGSALVWGTSERVHTSAAGLVFARGHLASAAALASHTITTSAACPAPADGSAVAIVGGAMLRRQTAGTCTISLEREDSPGAGTYTQVGTDRVVVIPDAANDFKAVRISREYTPAGSLRYRFRIVANVGSVEVDSADITVGPSA